jgi:Tol biopolymer transport system component
MKTPAGKAVRCALLLATALLPGPGDAAAQIGSAFGRNKVQYREFEWAVLATEHFDVYYYTEERPLAMRAARMAERSYALLNEALGHEIEARIPLILYTSHNDFRQTNTVGGVIPEGVRGVTESLKHRVILPFTGSYADFNHVLTHELVHAFQFDVMSRSERRSNPLQRPTPLWFMEGMAEYLSVGMDRGTETWVEDALANDELVSVSELNLLGDIRVYRFGQALWYYIGETYGRERVGEILKQAYALGNSDRALQEVLGVTGEELTQGWHAWIRENFSGSAAGSDPGEVAERVTRHKGYEFNLNVIPAISPDGRRIAYLTNRNLYNDIVVQDLDGGGSRVVVHGGRSGTFESLRFLDTRISWSPDGRYLALVGESAGRDAIYIVDAEDGDVERTIRPDMDGIISPAWSPDGRHLVFTGIRNGQSDLYVVDRAGFGLDALTDDAYSDLQPCWSPDGRSIAFASDRGGDTDLDRLLFGRLEIALFDLGSRTVRVLTDVGEDCHNPVWSPAGGRIAFVSSMEGAANVYAVDPAGGEIERMTDFGTGVGGITPTSPAISWSARSGALAFSAFSRGGWDIFVLEEDALGDGGTVEEETTRWSRVDYSAGEVPGETEVREEEYRSRFSPDILVGGVGYANNVGVAGQSYILISDMLGNRNFVVSTEIYGSLGESNLLFSYIDLTRRTNYALSAFQIRNNFGLFTARDEAGFVSQVYRGGGITLSRPFDMFTRLEYGAHAVILEEDVFAQSFVTGEVVTDSSALSVYGNPMAALVRDNSISGPTGPIAGHRFRLQVEGGYGQLTFTSLTADYRLYINFARRYTLAGRLIAAASYGGNRQIFRIGGPYTYRGADFGAIEGTRVLLENIEFRFPVLFWLPAKYDFFKGAAFWDMAAGWNDAFETFQPFTREETGFVRLRDLRAAFGGGLRAGLGYLVLRFDIAQETDLHGRVGPTRGFFSIGGDF